MKRVPATIENEQEGKDGVHREIVQKTREERCVCARVRVWVTSCSRLSGKAVTSI